MEMVRSVIDNKFTYCSNVTILRVILKKIDDHFRPVEFDRFSRL